MKMAQNHVSTIKCAQRKTVRWATQMQQSIALDTLYRFKKFLKRHIFDRDTSLLLLLKITVNFKMLTASLIAHATDVR
jgi:hypothetical protein